MAASFLRNQSESASGYRRYRQPELAAAALARDVKCQPLSWHRQLAARPGLILGYAATPPGVIAEGVAALGAALRELA